MSVTTPLPIMHVQTPDGTAAWTQARAMGDIQYTPLNPVITPPAKNPQWLADALAWLARGFAPVGRWLVLHPGAVAIGLGGLVVMVLGRLAWIIWRDRYQSPPGADTPAWTPDPIQAVALLADADALATAGRFDAAVHLLLQRSFDAIAHARPEWLTPASTAREITGIDALPAPARTAFGVIAREVERSRYALHPLGGPDWDRARAAYCAFAVPAGPA